MKSDTQFLSASTLGNYFNFSLKSDPFLVFPSLKHSNAAVGGGSHALHRLKSGATGQKKTNKVVA